jgi:hypothetical protein
MLLVLEDNPDKLSNLLLRYRDRYKENTLVICDTVPKAQAMIQKLVSEEPFELWLDEELRGGGSGHEFFKWLIEFQAKPSFLLITTLGLRAKELMENCARLNNVPYSVWAGPFS